MPRYELKLVPNDDPNADGFWVEADVDIESAAAAGKTGFRVFEDASPVPGHHVVNAVPFRGGEPMYFPPETRERDRLAHLHALASALNAAADAVEGGA